MNRWLPALLLLGLIWYMQRGRIKKGVKVAAGV